MKNRPPSSPDWPGGDVQLVHQAPRRTDGVVGPVDVGEGVRDERDRDEPAPPCGAQRSKRIVHAVRPLFAVVRTSGCTFPNCARPARSPQVEPRGPLSAALLGFVRKGDIVVPHSSGPPKACKSGSRGNS
jgi:hypothetical protein